MKTDFYTKAVLTVIAACLAIIVLQNVGLQDVKVLPTAQAANANNLAAQKVQLVDNAGRPLGARGNALVVKTGIYPMEVEVNNIKSVPVQVKNIFPVPVKVTR